MLNKPNKPTYFHESKSHGDWAYLGPAHKRAESNSLLIEKNWKMAKILGVVDYQQNQLTLTNISWSSE